MAPDAQAKDRAQVEAAEFLAAVRKSMKRGEMSAEPELELERRQAGTSGEEEDVDEDDDDEEDIDEDDNEDDDEDDEDEDEDEEHVDNVDGPTKAASHSLAQDDFFAL